MTYQIILLRNNENIKLYSSHVNRECAIKKFNNMLKQNQKVVFPMQKANYGTIHEVKYHLAIIKRKDNANDDNTPKLKNEYGEYVEHIVEDNDEWLMYMKEPYLFEETFWVYGFNPKLQRKDFMFIYNELVKKYSNNKYEFLHIWFYKNKVMFETPSHLDMVICKDKDESIRLINALEEHCKKDKNKYIMFGGDFSKNKSWSTIALDKIQNLTHWNRRKCNRHCTRP